MHLSSVNPACRQAGVNRQPLTSNRQPSTVNRQPSTVNRQPPTANRQPTSAIPHLRDGWQSR